MIRPSLPLALVLAVTTAGCDRASDAPVVVVSAIGGTARAGDPSRGPLGFPQRLMMDATAQGLVRFDAAGQIEPGLAERWIVSDGGLSYIFRLRAATWPNGERVTAGDVVAVLRRAAGEDSRNAMAPFLRVVDEIVEMTPEVVEVRLKRPRPDLLKLFAQPEMAIFQSRTLGGSGPFRVKVDRGPGVLLRPGLDPSRVDGEDFEEPGPDRNIRLHGERAARALVRFAARRSDLVTGGTFADWPLIAHAGIAPEDIRLDPALGLFGLAIVEREGFLARPENRTAIAMAIDRAALAASIRPGWTPVESLLPVQFDSAAAPAVPVWAGLPLDQRRIRARTLVAVWRTENPGPVVLRIALPSGPGATLLWGRLAASLIAIGVTPERVPFPASADLRLIDEVAPYDSGRWYLATACRPCSDDVMTLVDAARDAATLDGRAHRIAEADAALAADTPFIAIAQPLRWSIVAPRLDAWQGNTRAWHPLTHLRNETE